MPTSYMDKLCPGSYNFTKQFSNYLAFLHKYIWGWQRYTEAIIVAYKSWVITSYEGTKYKPA